MWQNGDCENFFQNVWFVFMQLSKISWPFITFELIDKEKDGENAVDSF